MSVSPERAKELTEQFQIFERKDFRNDLAALSALVRVDSQRWAEQAVITARLAALIPAERGFTDEAITWKSFVREIAVARRCSDQSAAKEIFLCVSLVQSHPRTLSLLKTGQMPLYNARVLLEETTSCEPVVVAAVDAELAEKACRLTPSRIRSEVRRIELRVDADAAAARSAKAASVRSVRFYGQGDDQATMVITGPMLPVARFYESITAAARAARAAGDDRGIDALRFDIAVDVSANESELRDNTPSGTVPPTAAVPTAAVPAESAPAETPATETPATETDPAAPAAVASAVTTAGTPSLGVPVWVGDRRRIRPIKILVHLPVTTALGLTNEPGWLPGYGWVSAPTCRQWLTMAELQQVCVGADGFVVDVADSCVRPAPTPQGVRDALLQMVRDPGEITDKTWRTEPRHDPSPALAGFVDVRDVFCDGPTGTRVPAARWPTAAWNLKSRSTRTHLLKHNGWTPLRTATSTLWFSPAGQAVEVAHHTGPPPELSPDAELPDPIEIHEFEAQLVRPPGPDDQPPWDEPPPF